MAESNAPVDEVQDSRDVDEMRIDDSDSDPEFEFNPPVDGMDMDIDHDNDSTIPPAAPLFTGNIFSAGPSGPPPDILLPPSPPARETNANGDPNLSTDGELPTSPYLHLTPDPFSPSSLREILKKTLTINLHSPASSSESGNTNAPETPNTPASTSSPTVLTHTSRKFKQEPGSLGISKSKSGDSVKKEAKQRAVPRQLKAGYEKYHPDVDERPHEVNVVKPLKSPEKKGSAGAGSRDGGNGVGSGSGSQKGGPLTKRTFLDLSSMLGLNPVRSYLDDFLTPQEPLIVGMARLSESMHTPDSGTPAKNSNNNNDQENDDEEAGTSALDDEVDDEGDDDDDTKSSVSAGAGGEPAKKEKKKTRRSRKSNKKKAKIAASGAENPGTEPAGIPTATKVPGGNEDEDSTPADSDSGTGAGEDQGQEKDHEDGKEKEEVDGGGGGEEGKRESMFPSLPPTPPGGSSTPPDPTLYSAPSAAINTSLPLSPVIQSPFVPAVPASVRSPPINPDDRATMMWEVPQNSKSLKDLKEVVPPLRQSEQARLDEERAILAVLVGGVDGNTGAELSEGQGGKSPDGSGGAPGGGDGDSTSTSTRSNTRAELNEEQGSKSPEGSGGAPGGGDGAGTSTSTRSNTGAELNEGQGSKSPEGSGGAPGGGDGASTGTSTRSNTGAELNEGQGGKSPEGSGGAPGGGDGAGTSTSTRSNIGAELNEGQGGKSPEGSRGAPGGGDGAGPGAASGSGSGAGTGTSLTATIPPRQEIYVPPEVRAYRIIASQPEHENNNAVQHGLYAMEAAFRYRLEPSITAAHDSLRYRSQIQALEKAANDAIAQLSEARKEAKDAERERDERDSEIARAYQSERDAAQRVREVEAKLKLEEEEKFELQKKLGEASKDIVDHLENKIRIAETELESLHTEIDGGRLISAKECEEQKSKLGREIEALQAMYEATVEEYKEGNMITREDCAKQTQEKDEVHAQRIEDLEADVNIAKKERDACRAKLDAVRTGTGISEDAEGEESAEKIKELEDRIAELQHALETQENDAPAAGVPEGFISEAECEEQCRSRIEEFGKEIQDLRKKNEALEQEVEVTKADLETSNNSTKFISILHTKRGLEVTSLKTHIADLTKELKDKATISPDSIAIADCESQKLAVSQKLEGEKKSLNKRIEEADSRAKVLEDRVRQLETENVKSSQRPQLRDIRDRDEGGKSDSPASLQERISSLGKGQKEINDLVASQGAQLRERGIRSHPSTGRILEEQNLHLTEQVTALEGRVEILKTRKVGSGYNSRDEKDKKIDELIGAIDIVNEEARRYHQYGLDSRKGWKNMMVERDRAVDRYVKYKEHVKAWAERENERRRERRKKKSEKRKNEKTHAPYISTATAGETAKVAGFAISEAKKREIEQIGSVERGREEIQSQIRNINGKESAAVYNKLILQAMIGLVEKCLGHLVAARALNGKQGEDSLSAIRAADDVMMRAERQADKDLTAQGFLWAGIAYFYDGQSQRAQEYLDGADELKDELKSDDDKKILDLWLKYGVESNSVEKRSAGYKNGLIAAKLRERGGRSRSSSISSRGRVPNYGNKMNDIPEFDSEGSVIGGSDEEEEKEEKEKEGKEEKEEEEGEGENVQQEEEEEEAKEEAQEEAQDEEKVQPGEEEGKKEAQEEEKVQPGEEAQDEEKVQPGEEEGKKEAQEEENVQPEEEEVKEEAKEEAQEEVKEEAQEEAQEEERVQPGKEEAQEEEKVQPEEEEAQEEVKEEEEEEEEEKIDLYSADG